MPALSQLKHFLILPLISALLLGGCGQNSEARRAAPNFSLEALSGDRVVLSHLKGKVVLVDFWATWCPPCRQSIPELVGLQKKYRDRGLVILGISMDDPQTTSLRSLQAFHDKFGINYQVLRGDYKVALDFLGGGEISIPTMFVVNREGQIVDKHVGFRPGVLEGSLKKYL